MTNRFKLALLGCAFAAMTTSVFAAAQERAENELNNGGPQGGALAQIQEPPAQVEENANENGNDQDIGVGGEEEEGEGGNQNNNAREKGLEAAKMDIALNNLLDALDKKIENLPAEPEDETFQAFRRLTTENEDLKENLNRTEQGLHEALDNVDQLTSRLNETVTTTEELKRELDDNRGIVKELQSDAVQFQLRITQLQNEIEEIKKAKDAEIQTAIAIALQQHAAAQRAKLENMMSKTSSNKSTTSAAPVSTSDAASNKSTTSAAAASNKSTTSAAASNESTTPAAASKGETIQTSNIAERIRLMREKTQAALRNSASTTITATHTNA